MKIKRIIALFTAIMLIASFAACGGSSQPPAAASSDSAAASNGNSPAEPAPAASSDEPVTLDFYFMCNDFYDGALEMVNSFAAMYPNVTANLAQLTTASCAEALQPRAAAGALPDVMSIDADTFGYRIADEGLLVDINDYPEIKANVIPSLISPYTSSNGVFYGVAGGLATSFLYYNKDLFNKAGIADSDIPSDWNGFLALCEKIKAAGIVPLITPASIAFSSMPNTFWTAGMATNFLAQGVDYGAEIQAGTFNFNVPEYAKVYSRVKELVDLDYFIRGINSLEYQQATDAFIQGEGAMLYGGSWLAGPIFDSSDFPIGIIRPTLNDPGQKVGTALGVETGFAAAKNKNEEWSMKFMDYIVNGEGFYIYQNARANLPYIVNVDQSKLVQEKEVSEYMDKLLNDPDVALGPFWFMILKSEMFGILPVSFTQVISGELTPEEAAKQFDDEYKATF